MQKVISSEWSKVYKKSHVPTGQLLAVPYSPKPSGAESLKNVHSYE